MSLKKPFPLLCISIVVMTTGLGFMGYGYNTFGLPMAVVGFGGMALIVFYLQWLR